MVEEQKRRLLNATIVYDYLRKNNMSVREFAFKEGICYETLSRALRMKSAPNFKTLSKISNAIDIPANKLVWDKLIPVSRYSMSRAYRLIKLEEKVSKMSIIDIFKEAAKRLFKGE